MGTIYLDNNATTPLDPGVKDIMAGAMAEAFGNPSSAHCFGAAARAVVEGARQRVAALLSCAPSEVIFTSGGTESNNLAIMGYALARGGGHIISTLIEHPSVLNPLRRLEDMGFDVTLLGVDSGGRVSAAGLERAIRPETILISVMHANNETGVLQPLNDIGEVARARGIVFHTDAAQSPGRAPLGGRVADMLTLVPHKFHGPKGTGALMVREGVELRPIMYGGGHERGLRPGTENVAAIAGMGLASELAMKEAASRAKRLGRLERLFLEELKVLVPEVRLNGHPELRLPGTMNLQLPGVNAARLAVELSGTLAISAGSACHSGREEPSAVLKAMGLGDDEALSSVRVSIGKENTEEEVRAAAGILSDRLCQPGPAR